MTPHMGMRSRRGSSASFNRTYSSGMGGMAGSFMGDGYGGRAPHIKFRVKGSFRSGLTLSEAVAGVRVSNEEYLDAYTLQPDGRGRMFLKVRWAGYPSLTYEIPLDSYDGVSMRMSTLARRVGRACVHFIQVNGIPIHWDRVKLYHLEEVAPGTWQPSLMIL